MLGPCQRSVRESRESGKGDATGCSTVGDAGILKGREKKKTKRIRPESTGEKQGHFNSEDSQENKTNGRPSCLSIHGGRS